MNKTYTPNYVKAVWEGTIHHLSDALKSNKQSPWSSIIYHIKAWCSTSKARSYFFKQKCILEPASVMFNPTSPNWLSQDHHIHQDGAIAQVLWCQNYVSSRCPDRRLGMFIERLIRLQTSVGKAQFSNIICSGFIWGINTYMSMDIHDHLTVPSQGKHC